MCFDKKIANLSKAEVLIPSRNEVVKNSNQSSSKRLCQMSKGSFGIIIDLIDDGFKKKSLRLFYTINHIGKKTTQVSRKYKDVMAQAKFSDRE